MASSWFQEFQAKRSNLLAKNSSNPALDLRSVQTAQLAPNWNPRDMLADAGVNGVGEHLLDWGGRALDIISRPGYAVGGFLNNILKEATNDKTAENPFGAAVQGFLGKEKEFFAPWKTLDPYEEGESGLKTGARFATDFLASILGDPVSYVPATAIARGLSKTGEVTGLAQLGKSLHAQNEVGLLEDVIPSPDVLDDIADSALPSRSNVKPTDIPNVPNFWQQERLPLNIADQPSRGPVLGPQPPRGGLPERGAIVPDDAQGVIPIPGEFGNPGYIGPQGPSQEILDRAASFDGSLSRKGTNNSTQLAVLSIVRDAINKELKNVKGKYNTSGLKDLYKVNQEAVDAALKDVPEFPVREFPEIPKPVAQDITRGVEAPGIPVPRARRLSLIERDIRDDVVTVKSSDDVERALMENPGKDIYDQSTNKFFDAESGEAYDPRDWAQRSGYTSTKGFSEYAEGKVIRLFGEKGHPLTGDNTFVDIPLAEFEKLFTAKGQQAVVNRRILEGLSIPSRSGKGLVPINEYVNSRNIKWMEGSKPQQKQVTTKGKISKEEAAKYRAAVAAQKAEQKAYEAAKAAHAEKYHFGNMEAADKVAKTKPTRQELENFLRVNKIVLNTDEKRAFLRAANLGEKSFNTVLSKMLESERRLNLESLDELAEGVKSGRIPEEVQQAIYNRLGAKSLTQAKNKLKSLDETITRLSAKENVKTPKDEYRPLNPTEHQADLIGDIPKALDEPMLPVSEVKATDAKKTPPSATVAEAVVDKAVSAPTAAALSRNDKIRLWYSLRGVIAKEWTRMAEMKFRSPRGAHKEEKELFKGDAGWWSEINLRKQQNIFQSMIGRVNADAKTLGLKTNKEGLQAYKYDKMMPMLKASDEILRQYGLHPTTHAGGKGYPISLYDVLSSLPRTHVERHVFNTGRQILPTQYLELAHAALDVDLTRGFTRTVNGIEEFTPDLTDWRDMVKGMLNEPLPENIKTGRSASDYARTQAEKAKVAELAKTAKTHNFDPNNPPANFATDAAIRYQKIFDRIMGYDPKVKGSASELMSREFVQKIQAKAKYNSDRAKLQYGQFVSNHAEKSVNEFLDRMNSAATGDDVFKIIDEANGTITKTIKEDATIIPPPGSVDAIKNALNEVTDANMATELARKQASAYEAAANANERAAVGVKTHEAMGDFVEDSIKMSPTADLSDKLEMTLFGKMVHAVFPHISEGDLRNMLLSREVAAGALTAQYSRNLGAIEQRLGKAKVKQIFDDVRTGHAPSAEELADYDEMRKAVARVFGEGRWSMKHNGIEVDHFNANMRHFRIPGQFRFESKNIDEAIEEWRKWEPDDPFDLLSRMDAALQKSIAERSLGDGISAEWGVRNYKPGYVRVMASTGKSRIAHLLDKTLWYPEDVAKNLRALDKTLADLSKPGTQNRLLQIFDSATHAYKAGLTIYRPGHHMRNLYGDIWLGYMDGVTNPRYYSRAQKILATRKTHYKDFNFDDAVTLNEGPVALRFTQGGKDVTLSEDAIYRIAFKHGLLPDYGTIEDLGIGARENVDIFGKASKIKPLGGKAHNVAAGVSEYRDHYVRLAHFLKVMEETKRLKPGKDALAQIDKLAEQASNRVRKWHPNGSDLTKFEKDVSRRAILFYSWIRKAIPLVVESAVMRPGRFMAFPKAMYSLAESQGIDLNGFTDPFPTDQLFPNWLGGTQGPQFGSAVSGYLGIRPGIPMMDIMDQYFADPATAFHTVMGATNPIIKVPYELTTGATTQGIPTDDVPKYLLGQVPFGNFVNTMLGKPVGGVSPSDEGYDPGGIRDPRAIATFNLLSGLGLMDMSRPSFIKSAEFDLKFGRQGG